MENGDDGEAGSRGGGGWGQNIGDFIHFLLPPLASMHLFNAPTLRPNDAVMAGIESGGQKETLRNNDLLCWGPVPLQLKGWP